MAVRVTSDRLERVAVKALRAAVGKDDLQVLRALQWCRGWHSNDMLNLCLVVAGRAAGVLAVSHGMPLGPGRWLVDEENLARHKVAPDRFAARFLVASANVDVEECRRLWAEQVEFSRHVVGVRSGETTVIRSAVVAVIAHSAAVHVEWGVNP